MKTLQKYFTENFIVTFPHKVSTLLLVKDSNRRVAVVKKVQYQNPKSLAKTLITYFLGCSGTQRAGEFAKLHGNYYSVEGAWLHENKKLDMVKNKKVYQFHRPSDTYDVILIGDFATSFLRKTEMPTAKNGVILQGASTNFNCYTVVTRHKSEDKVKHPNGYREVVYFAIASTTVKQDYKYCEFVQSFSE